MLVPTPFRRFPRVFFAFFASLAMVAQFVVALAPLDEGKEQRWGAHVEADGPVHHITHSEATCASCQARSILGTAANPSVPVFRDLNISVAPRHHGLDVVYSAILSKDNPRAPPA